MAGKQPVGEAPCWRTGLPGMAVPQQQEETESVSEYAKRSPLTPHSATVKGFMKTVEGIETTE